MTVDIFYMFGPLLLLVAGIAYMARSYYQKRVNEEVTIEQRNRNKRRVRQASVALAASVFAFLLSVSMTDWKEESSSQADVVAEKLPSGTYGPGTYKVGSDIPAGEYKLTSSESDYGGYYEVKVDMSADGGILSSALFDSFEYVEVRAGEYLKVNRATFTLVIQSSNESAPESESTADLEPVEEVIVAEAPYSFENEQQEAEFFKSISLTLEQGRETMREASALSRMCGKICPDVPGKDWGLQLQAMNQDVYALDRNLNDFILALNDIPKGGSPNIDFELRDTLVRDMERMSELIDLIMTKRDWETWADGWNAMDEANLLMEKMYTTDVYTVPQS